MDVIWLIKDLFACKGNMQEWMNHRFRNDNIVMIRRDTTDHIVTTEGLKFGLEGCEEFGDLMHESWVCKRALSDKVSTPEIDAMYEKARGAGAIGGKILGAGGGGFMLLFVRPEHQPQVREVLKDLVHVPFNFDESGSRIVMYQPNGAN
jgi:mevalonate kinase